MVSIDKLILFGSRATGLFSEDSDFDFVVVSQDFEGMPAYLRAQKTYPLWQDERPVELLCYTPAEFDVRLKSPIRNIVSDAVKSGIPI